MSPAASLPVPRTRPAQDRAGHAVSGARKDTTRSVRPDLRVVLRLYDDDFATAVYRTLRAA
ncbi:hypothetical protein ACWDAZ_33655, partial [Streptomyces sp. NPDC001215]